MSNLFKLIFLDLDGVMNSHQSSRYFNRKDLEDLRHTLCPIACSNLQGILEEHPETRIVISSSWRKSYSLDYIKEALTRGGVDASRVIGITPVPGIERELRGQCVRQWFKENPEVLYSHFVIIDDESDMCEFLNTPNFVQTKTSQGFMWDDMEKVLILFGDYNLRVHNLKAGDQVRLFSKPSTVIYTFDGKGFFYEDKDGNKHEGIHFYPATERCALVKGATDGI